MQLPPLWKAHTLWDDVPAGQGPRAVALLSLKPMPFEQEERTGGESEGLVPLLS